MSDAFPPVAGGRLVDVGDTRLHCVVRGGGFPLLCLHGGPGDDHTEFAHYLDPLAERYQLVLVDQRAQGRSDRDAPARTWTLAQMAADVSALAGALGLRRYAVLGHSYGAFVALQHAVDEPGAAAGTIVSSGVPASRWLAGVEAQLASFTPVELREQVAASWAREAEVSSQAEFAALMHDQLPFHFADPRDARIAGYEEATADAAYAPDVLRRLSAESYGAIEVEDRLGGITQPLLVLAGRHDRTCPVAASEAIAAGAASAELVVFEHSAHMTFVEEPEAYVAAVGAFLAGVAR